MNFSLRYVYKFERGYSVEYPPVVRHHSLLNRHSRLLNGYLYWLQSTDTDRPGVSGPKSFLDALSLTDSAQRWVVFCGFHSIFERFRPIGAERRRLGNGKLAAVRLCLLRKPDLLSCRRYCSIAGGLSSHQKCEIPGKLGTVHFGQRCDVNSSRFAYQDWHKHAHMDTVVETIYSLGSWKSQTTGPRGGILIFETTTWTLGTWFATSRFPRPQVKASTSSVSNRSDRTSGLMAPGITWHLWKSFR